MTTEKKIRTLCRALSKEQDQEKIIGLMIRLQEAAEELESELPRANRTKSNGHDQKRKAS